MNALLYFENGVYEILLRRTEEHDHNNWFKVKILLHPIVKRVSAFHHLLFFTLILGPFLPEFLGS